MNCATAHLECPYETISWSTAELQESLPPQIEENSPSEPSSNGASHTPTVSSSSRSPSSINLIPPPYTQRSPDFESGLNLVHLELLYWWSTNLFKSFVFTAEVDQSYADTCVNYGLRFPFLMRQILATSALNLSIERPDHKAFYHQHATKLQSEALASFTATLQTIDETNVVAVFLGSSLVGMHSFCETFTFREENFNHTLDALLRSMSLLRGTRAVIGGWWQFLCASEIGVILKIAHDKRQLAIDQQSSIRELEELIEEADISQKTKDTYKHTVEELALLFATQQNLTDAESSQSANMIFGWLVVVGKEYTDLLSARRAEALIILAHYAVVLHQRRNFWAIGDAGKYLIEAIDAHLGQHWDRWLAWPRAIVSM